MFKPLVHRLASPADFPEGMGLWLVDLDADTHAWDASLLDAQERQRAERFRFAVHAQRHVASHVALRQILADQMGCPAQALRFVHGAHGKPRLAAPDAPHFNLSHSGGQALIAVHRQNPIGVDLELPRAMPDAFALALQHFSADEHEAFLATPADAKATAFLRCWTRKEACLKALGSGLSVEPASFTAGLHADTLHTTLPYHGEHWSMRVGTVELPVAGLAAVAVLDRQDPPPTL